MAKTIFEEMGGTYTRVGDYYLPNLKLPEEEKRAKIGVWGMRHKRFLKENHRVLYLDNKTFVNNHLVRTGYVDVDTSFDYACQKKFLNSIPN